MLHPTDSDSSSVGPQQSEKPRPRCCCPPLPSPAQYLSRVIDRVVCAAEAFPLKEFLSSLAFFVIASIAVLFLFPNLFGQMQAMLFGTVCTCVTMRALV